MIELKGYANLWAEILYSNLSPCNIWLSVIDLVQGDI